MVVKTNQYKYEQLKTEENENPEKSASLKKKLAGISKNQHFKIFRTTVFITLTVILCFIYMFCASPLCNDVENIKIFEEPPPLDVLNKYLVFNKKCRIFNIDAFNKELLPFIKPGKYMKCTNHPILTSMSYENDSVILRVKKNAAHSYTKDPITCCYSNVTRNEENKEHDCCIKISHCTEFEEDVKIENPIVLVTCTNKKTKKEVYKNAHTVVKPTKTVLRKIEAFNSSNRHLSVLIIGIDSVSRLNFIRSLPKTKSFLESNRWIELKGYNKIGDNTFPNLMGILTGKNESKAYKTCNPKQMHKLDQCNFIWKEFDRFGYITGYAEDAAKISTFNYEKKGFTKAPADYYFRPYILAAERLKIVTKDSLAYCTGPENSGERIFNLARDFTFNFKDYPFFGFFWMNTFSHNDVNTVAGMDDKVKEFLEDITNAGVLNNTIVIFLSDHGMRFGKIRLTHTGWYEERLPMIYFSFPDWFADEFPLKYEYFKINTARLTTPYDVHMTLQDILIMAGHNYTVVPSDACPSCSSLFSYIKRERSCEDAAIDSHWCTCKPFQELNSDIPVVKDAINYVIKHMRFNLLKDNPLCAPFALNKVIHSKITGDLSSTESATLLTVFETKPEAIFEATLVVRTTENSTNFDFDGNISRLDSYGATSSCINDASLKKYCYCR